MKLINMTGQVIGRLTVLRRSETTSTSRRTAWVCRCTCGAEKVVARAELVSGHTSSCGCLRRETSKERKTIHGHGASRAGRRTTTYVVWSNLIQRTTNPKHPAWDDYGGRGITVCDRWRQFENFLADMGERPPSLTIDRIDNDGNYEPGNCRWADWHTQRTNSRPRKRSAA